MRIVVVIAAVVIAACTYDGRPLVGADGGVVGTIDATGPDGSAVSAIDATPGPADATVIVVPDASAVDAEAACPEELGATCAPGGTCGDGDDNDGDGATDCQDSGCAGVCGLSVCCPDGSCADLIVLCF